MYQSPATSVRLNITHLGLKPQYANAPSADPLPVYEPNLENPSTYCELEIILQILDCPNIETFCICDSTLDDLSIQIIARKIANSTTLKHLYFENDNQNNHYQNFEYICLCSKMINVIPFNIGDDGSMWMVGNE